MKLARYYLEQIDGVELYPIIAFIIFIVFFLAIGIWVLRLKKAYVEKMSHAPLNDDIKEQHK